METRPIFITGRFRSGSTLLWHLFRSTGLCTAFYEPCHEMLPERAELNNDAQPDHVGVESYWDEYLPLFPGLKSLHRPEFGLDRLLLEEDDEHPALKKYIAFLLSGAERTPVLQFNRMDFRLPWLRRNFPGARVIHLFRDPREQWISLARNLSPETWEDPFENTSYDLLVWSASLLGEMPFLANRKVSSSYHRHYLLWRLSRIMGERCSEVSLGFEDLVGFREKDLEGFFQDLGLEGIDAASLRELVRPPGKERWKGLVGEDWFEQKEQECEECLTTLGLSQWFGLRPLSRIRGEHQGEWERYGAEVDLIHPLLKYFNRVRTDAFKVQFSTTPYIRYLESRQERSEAELKTLRSELGRAQEARADLAAEKGEAESRSARLAMELEQATGRNETQNALLENSRQERADLAEMLRRLEAERDDLAKRLGRAQAEGDDLARRLDRIETERADLEERLGEAEARLEELRQGLSAFPLRLFAGSLLRED